MCLVSRALCQTPSVWLLFFLSPRAANALDKIGAAREKRESREDMLQRGGIKLTFVYGERLLGGELKRQVKKRQSDQRHADGKQYFRGAGGTEGGF